MNSYNVISENADVAMNEHVLVEFTPTGVKLATAATDFNLVAGTNHHPVDANKAAAVLLRAAFGLHYVTVGSATAIASGDELDLAADGKVVKAAGGTKIGVAREPSGGVDSIIRARLYS
jgi:hypothetical protein